MAIDKKPFSAILSKLIVTKEGKRLGMVKDITFETRTGELIHLVVKDPTPYTKNLNLESTQSKEILIPYNSIIAIGDFVVVPVSFTLIFGRLANFINQELVGRITDVSWCFNFSMADGCRHPYQLYSAFGHFLLFLLLILMSRRNYRREELFWSFVSGYGLMRFLTDFFRENPTVFGLTGWQWISILFFLIGVYYLKKARHDNTDLQSR